MRTAEDIIQDYRACGYSDERLQALANGRSDPIRTQMLEYLDANPVANAEALIEDVQVDASADIPADAEESAVLLVASDEEVNAVPAIEEILPAGTFEPIAEETDETVLPVEQAESVAAEQDSNDIMAETSENTETQYADGVEEPATITTPALTKIQVEHLSKEEYNALRGESFAIPDEIIDLRESIENVAENEAVTEAGEHWPSAESVEAAEHEDTILSQESALIKFEESVGQIDMFAVFEKHKSAQRSIKVLQEAFENAADLKDAVAEAEENILALNAPYALEDAPAELALTELNVDAPVADEQSSLIRFPTDVIPLYEAINDSKNINTPEENTTWFGEEEIEAIHLFDELEADAEVAEAGAAVSTVVAETENTESVAVATNEIEQEIAQLRNWMAELEDEVKCKDIEAHQLTAMIEDRNSTLAMQGDEIKRLREQVSLQTEGVGSLSEIEEQWQGATANLEVLQTKHAALEREYNILSTETVPNLQNDKTDLQQLLEERSIEQSTLRTALSSSGRRVALGYTLAAAASILMVLMPVLHVLRSGNTATMHETEKKELVAELDSTTSELQKTEETMLTLQQEAQQIRHNYEIDRQLWEQQEKKLKGVIESKVVELARVQQSIGDSSMPSPDNVRQSNADTGLAAADAGTLRVRRPHRNGGIENLDETPWGRATDSTTTAHAPIARVQRGEGIADVLRRKTGVSGDQGTWDEVARINNLRKSSRGYYIIHPGQELKLPAPTAATASIR